MRSKNRFSEGPGNLPTLEEMCQFLVWTAEDLKELQRILKNAPVTLSEGITDFECHYPAHLSYLASADLIFAGCEYNLIKAGIEGVKLSEREYHRCVEILVDPNENIPRDWEEAKEAGWDIGNYHGMSILGKEQLVLMPHLSRTLEIYESKPDNKLLVIYNQNEKDYLLSLMLFDRGEFFYPLTKRISKKR